jgi:hypothetical protein
MKIRCQFATLLAAALSLPLAAQAAEKRLYRYTNADGSVVIDDRVPREFAGRGYDILNADGVVLETVPRELSEQERAERAREDREREAARIAQEQARERDRQLLLRYSTIEDIEAAKARALQALQVRVGILKSNRRGLKSQMEYMQAQAAETERLGREVGRAQVRVMEDLRDELLNTEQSIVSREAELKSVAASYDSDIDRFEELLELVEWRRRREREVGSLQ